MKYFSLQLYSLRNLPSLEDRLVAAAQAGYLGVELCEYGLLSAKELKSLLQKHNLRGVGFHIGPEALKADLDGCVAYCQEAGIETATCPCIDMKTVDQTLEAATFLETCAARFEAAGIPFAYHNHAHEFAADNGRVLYDVLVENTRKTGLELDVYWAAFAGHDPEELIHRYAGRFSLLHFKEMGADKKNVELGKGFLHFPSLASLGFAQGVREIIVEQEDYTMDPVDSIRADADFMRALTY